MLQEVHAHKGAAAEDDPQQGFYLEYVLQACPAPERDAAPLPGPHVLEIILKGASLHWPYLARLDFVMAIAKTYSHCFIKPWTAPNPPVRVPSSPELSHGSCQLWPTSPHSLHIVTPALCKELNFQPRSIDRV